MESENASFQDLESYGEERIFKIAIKGFGCLSKIA